MTANKPASSSQRHMIPERLVLWSSNLLSAEKRLSYNPVRRSTEGPAQLLFVDTFKLMIFIPQVYSLALASAI
jgi:hypothetical protein